MLMNTIERYIFKTLISFPLDSGVDESCAICVYFVRNLHSGLSRAFVLCIYIVVISLYIFENIGYLSSSPISHSNRC